MYKTHRRNKNKGNETKTVLIAFRKNPKDIVKCLTNFKYNCNKDFVSIR